MTSLEQNAHTLLEELCSVENGVRDASKIHRIANEVTKLLLGQALPLIHTLRADVHAAESSSSLMPVAAPQLLQDTLSTAKPRAPSSSAASEGTEHTQSAESLHSSSTMSHGTNKISHSARPPKASYYSCQPVREWRGLTTIDISQGSASSSGTKKRSLNRSKCPHAPHMILFADSRFQGRGTHARDSFRKLDDVKRRKIAKQKKLLESVQLRQLFAGNGESDSASVSGEQRDQVARRDADNEPLCSGSAIISESEEQSSAQATDAADKDPLCGVHVSPSKCCSCCQSSSFHVGCCVRQDTMDVDFSEKVAQTSACSSGSELVVWTPPPPWAPSWWAEPSRILKSAWIVMGSTDFNFVGALPGKPDVDEGGAGKADVDEADVETASWQQPADRDPGATNTVNWDAALGRDLDQRLRITFQRCETDRLEAARAAGWIKGNDYDFVKHRSILEDSEATGTATATVQVPKRGPSKLVASSSGMLSNAGIRHRRILLARARLLYLSAAVRSHHEALPGEDGPDDFRMASVRALLSDLPIQFLRCLSKDPRVQDCAITSEKKMRKKILRQIKKEAAETRKDPMTVLKATIDHSSRAGSIKAYQGMQAILNKSGFGHCLPSTEAMSAAKKGIMRLAEEDLEIFETPDGYRISLKRAVEMEASRIMQTISMSELGVMKDSGKEVRTVGVQPGGHGWQDLFDVKITFDARRVTKHGSQTEVMMIFMLKGQEGVDSCQKALKHRTIAIWAGKDSRENVQRNLVETMKEARELEENGIVFSIAADSFLTVQDSEQYNEWKKLPEAVRNEMATKKDDRSFHNVGIRFWVPADMLAQCSLLGQGCAGKHYCPHCNTHKDFRHIPFELRLVTERVNFRKYAEQLDLHAETLWSINTCENNRGPNWKLNEEGLRFMTEPSSLVLQTQPVVPGPSTEAAPARSARERPAHDASTMRPNKKRRTAAASAAPKSLGPAPSSFAADSDGVSASNRASNGRALGPDVDRLRKLDRWRHHGPDCECYGCMIPANTVVRTMLTPGMSRPSAFLGEHWPQMTSARCPFCALHCLMRVTEAMFQQICQFALAGGAAHLKRLNDGLSMVGFKSKKFEKLRNFDSKNYEKLSFLGHESLHLLKRKDGVGDRNIAVLLKHIWPQGDAPDRLDKVDGASFVARSLDLWEQWAKVVELMIERDPEKVREQKGFENFGKECRDFIFLFQAMFHKAQCKAFYLHTLMAHAGDFMRELGKYGMCLGMMSNSGAERRHEYGRRAFKRSLCGGCWAKTNKELAAKRNLIAYLTLREVLMFQYGADLWSHEMALRADLSDTSRGGESTRTVIGSRRSLVKEALASLAKSAAEEGSAVRSPLLSFEDVEKEMRGDCDLGASAPWLETDSADWTTTEHGQSKVLESVPFEGEWNEGDPLPPGTQKQADGKLSYLTRDPRLTNGIADCLSDCSGDGSEDSSDTEGDSCRFEDLACFESDSEDGEYAPEVDAYLLRVQKVAQTVGICNLEDDDVELLAESHAGTLGVSNAQDRRKRTRSDGTECLVGKIAWGSRLPRTEAKNQKRREDRTRLWGAQPKDTGHLYVGIENDTSSSVGSGDISHCSATGSSCHAPVCIFYPIPVDPPRPPPLVLIFDSVFCHFILAATCA